MFTVEERRRACVHEAAHALVHSLGGAFVHRIAVAPVGVTEWDFVSRKGRPVPKSYRGICEPSKPPSAGFTLALWDDATRGAAREAQRRLLDSYSSRSMRAEYFRQTRAYVCGAVAGPIADQIITHPHEPTWLEPWDSEDGRDVDIASRYCCLLPWDSEFHHLAALTEQVLRTPSVWSQVLLIADRLEAAGELDGDDLDSLLLQRLKAWPPSPRHKRAND